jgi:hypothetical protein
MLGSVLYVCSQKDGLPMTDDRNLSWLLVLLICMWKLGQMSAAGMMKV